MFIHQLSTTTSLKEIEVGLMEIYHHESKCPSLCHISILNLTKIHQMQWLIEDMSGVSSFLNWERVCKFGALESSPEGRFSAGCVFPLSGRQGTGGAHTHTHTGKRESSGN